MESPIASSPMTALLRLLSDGALHAPADLAPQLGLSEPLVMAMIEDLTHRGYLAPIPQGCPICCAGCGRKQACHVTSPLLALTPKGLRAVKAGRA